MPYFKIFLVELLCAPVAERNEFITYVWDFLSIYHKRTSTLLSFQLSGNTGKCSLLIVMKGLHITISRLKTSVNYSTLLGWIIYAQLCCSSAKPFKEKTRDNKKKKLEKAIAPDKESNLIFFQIFSLEIRLKIQWHCIIGILLFLTENLFSNKIKI